MKPQASCEDTVGLGFFSSFIYFFSLFFLFFFLFSCYLHSLFGVRLLSGLPRFISPSDVAAPLLHPGGFALRRSERRAPPAASEVMEEGWGGGEPQVPCVAWRGRSFLVVMGDEQRFQELVGGFSGAFTDANAVPLEPGGGVGVCVGWGGAGGRQGGDTCPHQPANAKHVSNPPSAPPRENGRDLLHF